MTRSPSRLSTRPGASISAAIAVALALLATVLSLAPAASARGGEGWGRYPSFIGRYHLRVAAGGDMHVVGGRLTMFRQEEFPGSVQPAGIINLKTRNGRNDVVYLTDLTHRGARGRFATIKGGSFLGPRIGAFAGRLLAPGRIRAAVTTRGLGTVKGLFVRFSSSPTP